MSRFAIAFLLLLPVLAGLIGVGKPNGPLIVLESGTVRETPALCSSTPMCHAGSLSGGSVQILGVPDAYLPGEIYNLELDIQGIEFLTRVYGFQVAAFFASDGEEAGMLIPVTEGTQRVALPGEVPVLTHTDPLDSGRVQFSWKAPENSLGEVTIRVASNSADENFSPTNDLINTAEVVIPPAGERLPEDLFYFPQIGVGEGGGIRFLTDLIFLNSGDATALEVRFFESTGNPLELLVDTGEESQVTDGIEKTLEQGETFIARLSGSEGEGIRAGYARVASSGRVGGTALFTQLELPSGKLQYQAGVAATQETTSFSLPVQFEAGASDTGLALVRPFQESVAAGESEPPVILRLYDERFQLVVENSIHLAPGEHLPRFVSQLFSDVFAELESFRGSLTVESPFPVVPVTLLQTSSPTLTAFPVIQRRADEPPPNGP